MKEISIASILERTNSDDSSKLILSWLRAGGCLYYSNTDSTVIVKSAQNKTTETFYLDNGLSEQHTGRNAGKLTPMNLTLLAILRKICDWENPTFLI